MSNNAISLYKSPGSRGLKHLDEIEYFGRIQLDPIRPRALSDYTVNPTVQSISRKSVAASSYNRLTAITLYYTPAIK